MNPLSTAPLVTPSAPVPEGYTAATAPTVLLPFDPTVLHALPEGALLAGRFVVRTLVQHTPQRNLYRAQARQVQRCGACGTLAALDAPACTRCGAVLTGQPPLDAYLVAEAFAQETLLADPAVVARGLHHPHLLSLADQFSYAPYAPLRYYTVAEARVGLPLAELPVPQPPAQVVEWGIQLSDALQYLHEQGLAGPSAGPGSVLVAEDGALLTGLEAVRPAPADPAARAQAEAEDVVALAATLYEVLTGRYAGAAGAGLLLPASWPAEVETAFGRALRPAPAADPLSAAAWRDLLLPAREALRAAPANLRIRSGRLSDVGRRRPLNEDSLAALECQFVQESVSAGIGVYAVADGMGGHASGEVASTLAVAGVMDHLVGHFVVPQLSPGAAEPAPGQIGTWLGEAVARANGRVFEERTAHGTDMGTTLVLAVVSGPQVYIANVGDSRAYILRPGPPPALRQVTVDHSLVQRLVSLGQITAAEALHHPFRNVIYRSLGEKSQVEPDTFVEALAPGTRLLLCSDGLSGPVSDAEIAAILAGEADPQAACARLVAAANVAGGPDNITAVVVYVEAA